MRWRVENVSGEDIPLQIRTWTGQVIDDVFHAGEVVLVSSYDACNAIRRYDPTGRYVSVQPVVEKEEKVNWKKEGF